MKVGGFRQGHRHRAGEGQRSDGRSSGRTADRVSFGSSAIVDARGTVVRAGRELSGDILVAEVHTNGQDSAVTRSSGSNAN